MSCKVFYPSIDLLKFFFSLCVVGLHIPLYKDLPGCVDYYLEKIILRSAVPFFFVASGFFLGEKMWMSDANSKNIIYSYCKRLVTLLFIWEAVYLLQIYTLPVIHLGFEAIDYRYVLSHIIFYPYVPLWFLQACIIGSLMILPFVKCGKLNLAFLLGVLLFSIGLLGNNYHFLMNERFQNIFEVYVKYCFTVRNGVFVGFLWLTIGILISKYRKQLSLVLGNGGGDIRIIICLNGYRSFVY